MALQAELLETTEALEPHLAAWDALAVARGRPYCAPGWMLSWLRAVAPPDALLRACVVTEGGELVGIAPLWAQEGEGGGRYSLLSENTASPVEPLCARGRENEVAAAFGALLAEASPRPREIQLKYAPAGSPWPRLLAEHVPGYSPPSIECTRVMALPKVRLDQPSMDAWLATRSRNFRQQLRRAWRRLEDEGAVLRSSSGQEIDGGIEALSRLHHARWDARGGSRALNPRVEEMLRLAARELGDERLRLLSLDVDGASISSHLFVRCGRDVCLLAGRLRRPLGRLPAVGSGAGRGTRGGHRERRRVVRAGPRRPALQVPLRRLGGVRGVAHAPAGRRMRAAAPTRRATGCEKRA